MNNNDDDDDSDLESSEDANIAFKRQDTMPDVETFSKITKKESKINKKKAKKKKLEEEFELKISNNGNIDVKDIHKSILGDDSDEDMNGLDGLDGDMSQLNREEMNVANKNIFIKDPMWNIIHDISKKICLQWNDIVLPKHKKGKPQFGRNTKESDYGNEFTIKPKNGTIISLNEYTNQKYMDIK